MAPNPRHSIHHGFAQPPRSGGLLRIVMAAAALALFSACGSSTSADDAGTVDPVADQASGELDDPAPDGDSNSTATDGGTETDGSTESTGGLVYTTDAGLFWAGVDVQHQVYPATPGQDFRLLDVAKSSLGTVALALWDVDGTQQLGGFILESPGEPAFVHPVSNGAWTTTHAALIGDDRDQILLSGSANGCLGVAAIDFVGQPVGVANLPLLTTAATDPTATTDVCSDRDALVAAWGPDGNVVVVEDAVEGKAVRLTVYDTQSTSADSWFISYEVNVGPRSADFIDIDVAPNGRTTALVAQRVGTQAFRFDPAELFTTERDSIYIMGATGSAADARMVSLAPEFNSDLATPTDALMMAMEEASEPAPEASCGLDAYSEDHVAIDLLGDGTDELWNFGAAGVSGGQVAYVLHGQGDPAACEEVGALLGDEQLTFTSSFSAASPAGWYCVGSGPYELVQWFGNAGAEPGDASVELQRFTPPDAGNVWSDPVVEVLSGLDAPFPPDLKDSTCPAAMQPSG